MARKKDEVRPLFPLKHEFYASLDAFVNEAGMLAEAVRSALSISGVIENENLRKIFQERLDAFAKVRLGDKSDE